MWELKAPKPVKLIIGILAPDRSALKSTSESIQAEFGQMDLKSDIWPFTQTDYYKEQIGQNILRQFVSIEKLIDPGQLTKIKHKTNELEQLLAKRLALNVLRPVNLDPGIIEPSKLVLATTKNYSHRIYIGDKIYAEVTLIYDRGNWNSLPYTYPDYKQKCYIDFFERVRKRLLEQLKSQT